MWNHRKLGDVLAQHDRIDFLKMDIEGAEWEVLKDCAEKLSNVQNFFLEYHGKVQDTSRLNDLLHIMNRNKFKVYIRNAADNLAYPFIEKNTSTIYDVQLNIFCYK